MNTLAQRIALYFTLGMLLTLLDITVFVWHFWAIMALFWCSEHLTRRETKETAMAEGISRFLNMSTSEQNEIKRIHQQIQRESNND